MSKPTSIISILLTFFLTVAIAQENTSVTDAQRDSILWDSVNYWWFKNADTSIYYIHKILEHSALTDNQESYCNALNGLANWYFQESEIELFYDNMMKALEQSRTKLGEHSEVYGNALFNQATYFQTLGDYDSATEILEKIIRLKIAGSPLGQAIVIQTLGDISQERGDFQEALIYYDRIYQVDLNPDQNPNLIEQINLIYIKNLNKLGQVHINLNQLDQAIPTLLKAKPIFDEFPKDAKGVTIRYKIDVYNSLAKAYLLNNDYQQAIRYAQWAIALTTQGYTQRTTDSYTLIGQTHLATQNQDEAIRFFKKALKNDQTIYEDFNKHYNLAIRHLRLAQAYQAMDSIDRSLSYYQEGLLHATYQFDYQSIYDLPSKEDIQEDRQFLDLLSGKAATLKAKYQSGNGTVKDLKAALQTCWLAHDFVRVLYEQFQAEGSKFSLYKNVLPLYELSIEVANNLFQITADKQYLHQAWQFAEFNKAVTLQESLNENLALGMGQVPDSLLANEKNFKLQINYLKKIIAEAKTDPKQDASAIKQRSSKLFELKRQHQELVKQIKQSYPQYYDYKYDISPVELSKLQALLDERKATLIEYFVGNQNVYTFCITPSGIQLSSFSKSKFHADAITQLRLLLTSEPQADNYDEELKAFQQQANLLYKQLVEQPLAMADQQAERLIIVPDGLTNYVPFELLLKDIATSKRPNYSLRSLSYLLEDYFISYAYSATHLFKSITKYHTQPSEYFIGFAPSFEGPNNTLYRNCSTDAPLSALHCNQSEITNIYQITKGDYYLAQEAKKNHFLDQAANYRIIHLATHACVDPVSPQLNKIYFTDGYLTHFDLQHRQLNADLVVLSACNTGTGKLQEGEGLMSLSRSFHIAGCKSSLMSLWQVDDCITSQVMEFFYTFLQKGHSKDEALQNAKIAYLKQSDIAGAHPYYWGAFVLFGNIDNVENPAFNLPSWAVIGLTGILLTSLLLSWKWFKAS